jgi:phage I-like protein
VSNTVGYWVDLQGKQFDEDGCLWIQGMPLGTYEHPLFGEITFDADRVKRFADSVTTKVRGQDLDIDYDHKADTKIAAGWVKTAEVRGNDGLFLKIQFTEKARKHLHDGEYRYFSPEYQDEWEHPKTKQVHKDVLFGGALTNRPFLKDIMPINLSEVFDNAGKPMTTSEEAKNIRTKLGLPEDASEADVLAALPAKDKPAEDDKPAPDAPAAPQLSEEDLKKFPFLKTLQEQVSALQAKQIADAKELSELRRANKLAEVTKTVASLTDSSSKIALSSTARELAGKILLGEDVPDSMQLLLNSLVNGSATVELGERGRARTEGEKSGIQELNDAVAAVRATDKELTYSSAVTRVLAEKPALYSAYRDSLMAGEGAN